MRIERGHLHIGPGGRLQCNHCGATHDPFKGEAVERWAIVAASRGFSARHARCPKPKGPLCTFCLLPTHPWHEHVNATTKGPNDWWDCGDTGTSSQSIWQHMMGVPDEMRYPLDPDDFGRCYRLVIAPWAGPWKARLEELVQYGGAWERLVCAWAELEKLYLEELPTGRGPRLWEVMRKLIEEAQ